LEPPVFDVLANAAMGRVVFIQGIQQHGVGWVWLGIDPA